MSKDGTSEIVNRFAHASPRIIFIQNPSRIVAARLNAAIRAAQGEIILRMDAHTEYTRDYVKTRVATLENTGAQNVDAGARN